MTKKISILFISMVLLSVLSICVCAQQGPRGGKSPLSEMDTDGNGSVSSNEWLEFHKKMFSSIDSNGNGSLSEDELKSFHDKQGSGPRRKQ